MSFLVKIIYILLITIDVVSNSLCIYSISKLKSFKNCFGYLCFCISVTVIILTTVKGFYCFYKFDTKEDEAIHQITISERLIGAFMNYLWILLRFEHLFLTINRVMAIFFPIFYYQKFHDKASIIYIALMLVTSITFAVPYLDDRCIFYYNAKSEIWEFLNTPCKILIDQFSTLYLNIALIIAELLMDASVIYYIFKRTKQKITIKQLPNLKTEHLPQNNRIRDMLFTTEHIFAFQCVFWNISLFINTVIFTGLNSIIKSPFYLSFAQNINDLVYFSFDAILLIVSNKDVRNLLSATKFR
uniref:7TM_GPCR_Srx domain-containing protein n=1 Tax=Rhabditophanes sp. KR3021 TaxID=114890 RepID=A0AC35TZX1_9BILA